jgi:hypothetical protein
MGDCMDLVSFLSEAERTKEHRYGNNTRFIVNGTDFSKFFPSNTKLSVVVAAQRALQMIKDGLVAEGCRKPRNQWISIPVNGRGTPTGKAVWGRYLQEGWQCRQTQDMIEFLKFRAEVASSFCVGDTILESPEVIIGEPTSPALCDLAAKLREHDFLLTLTEEEHDCFCSKRYCDDGCDVVVYDCSDAASRARAESVMEKHKVAYPGITVTHEGRADENGGELKMLEYTIGVGTGGRSLTWHYNNKNADSVFEESKQRFLKLRNWRSGTNGRKLLEVVKSRLVAMQKMTRDLPGHTGGPRGSGDVMRDLRFTVWEFITEVHCCLQYPMRALLQCVKKIARHSSVWSIMLEDVLQIKDLL